jgi:hypothetical protein
MLAVLLTLACSPTKAPEHTDTAPAVREPVPWTGGLAPTSDDVPAVRQWRARRGIVHLHSPWSHDACDGQPLIEGEPDLDCLADLRDGLCTTSMDFAYLTDHPSHAAGQPFASLLFAQPNDELVTLDGRTIANRIPCASGSDVLWMPGIEDELMPVGLTDHVAGDDAEENNRLYNLASPESIAAEQAAGGIVLMAHTEGKDLDTLTALVRDGLQGVEIFNLHAMFDPNKREEDLGLDRLGWLNDIGTFTNTDGTAEPDLLFLGVLQEQTVSLEKWDALQATAPVVGVAGTDAHQNVLPVLLRDGERGDSYRRMLRWFSNHLLVDAAVDTVEPNDIDDALQSGRAYVAFEILGTPAGFDFYLEDTDGAIYDMGSDAPSGDLVLQCPALSDASPTNLEAPQITATIFKNGAPWSTGCSRTATDGPGVYRVRVDIVPYHLTDSLGEDPDTWLHSYPWVYSNPIRVQ